jgi:hypothetical protein
MTGLLTSAIIQNIKEIHLFDPERNDTIAIAADDVMRSAAMAEIGNAPAL